MDRRITRPEDVPLVVVVGICAVGKSTLVDALRDEGFAALEVAQEHSEIPYLWARSNPDLVIYLDAADEVVGARRSYLGPQRLARERQLLDYARQKSDLNVDTTNKTASQVLCEVLEFLKDRQAAPVSGYQRERDVKERRYSQ